MTPAPLERLVERSRALPGKKSTSAGLPRASAAQDAATGEAIEPGPLQARLGACLRALSARLDETLPRALRLAGSAWDQVDSLTVMDPALRSELGVLRAAAASLAAAGDQPQRRATGLAAELTLDAACGLVALFERRLATLVRLRLRSATPELLDEEGRPFLDLGAALAEVAQQW